MTDSGDVRAAQDKQFRTLFLSLFGGAFAVGAVIKLMVPLKQGGIGAALQFLVDKYSEAMGWLLGWAQPCMTELLRSLATLFPQLPLTLHGLWHDLFVLFGLAVSADVRADFSSQRPRSALTVGLFGYLVALAASVIADALATDTGPTLGSTLAILGGYAFYSATSCTFQALLNPQPDAGRFGTWLNFMYRFPFAEILIGIFVLVGGALLQEKGLQSAWFVAFLAFVFLLGAKNLVQAEMYGWQRAIRAKQKPIWFVLRTSRFGRNVLIVLVLAAIAVIVG